MKPQRRFAPKGGEFAPESVARFIGIRNYWGRIIGNYWGRIIGDGPQKIIDLFIVKIILRL